MSEQPGNTTIIQGLLVITLSVVCIACLWGCTSNHWASTVLDDDDDMNYYNKPPSRAGITNGDSEELQN